MQHAPGIPENNPRWLISFILELNCMLHFPVVEFLQTPINSPRASYNNLRDNYARRQTWSKSYDQWPYPEAIKMQEERRKCVSNEIENGIFTEI